MAGNRGTGNGEPRLGVESLVPFQVPGVNARYASFPPSRPSPVPRRPSPVLSASDVHEEEALGKAYDGRLMRRLLRYARPYRALVVGSRLSCKLAQDVLEDPAVLKILQFVERIDAADEWNDSLSPSADPQIVAEPSECVRRVSVNGSNQNLTLAVRSSSGCDRLIAVRVSRLYPTRTFVAPTCSPQNRTVNSTMAAIWR